MSFVSWLRREMWVSEAPPPPGSRDLESRIVAVESIVADRKYGIFDGKTMQIYFIYKINF